jgi:D-alanyl-D-alanine carboxypeptidase (penicillin-binding protein 5/6)
MKKRCRFFLAAALAAFFYLISSVKNWESSSFVLGNTQMGVVTETTAQETIAQDPVSAETDVGADASEEIEEPSDLYALSAVLMDASSGRVLYDKAGDTARPMASTTKVMTCILAIENAPGDDYVQVSSYAASQPEVKLGMQEGEQYYLEDLLYSLMLKSHNDTAVAIAEHIGGSVEGFAAMMNEKAREIGCTDTYFVTPNGLDASDEGGEHHTTARDLALIMRYAIQNQVYLRITQTREYSFTDLSGRRQFTVSNANALLDMTDGVLSGKTGYTGNAGYCYVCACEKEGKTFIVALLGCGWPNNKSYKWKDTLKLLSYGARYYSYQTIYEEPDLPVLTVEDGVTDSKDLWEVPKLSLHLELSEERKEEQQLLRADESVRVQVDLPQNLTAPVKEGEEVGLVTWYVGDEEACSAPICADYPVEKLSYLWCAQALFQAYFH